MQFEDGDTDGCGPFQMKSSQSDAKTYDNGCWHVGGFSVEFRQYN